MPLLDARTDRASIESVSISREPWHAMPRINALARRKDAVVCLVVIALAAWVLASFHDRFWWPPDDGAYGYVASRILAGDVLHRDVQDVHAGYVNFANAAALAFFGDDLVSMRYPLAVLTLAQTGLIFGLLLPAGAFVAAAGAAGMATLSFIQFLNPTAHWYALFVTVAILAALAWIPRGNIWRLPTIGFLLVTLFLFRQLSGVLVGMGVLTYLLCAGRVERIGTGGIGTRLVSRALLAIMALGLSGYLFAKIDVGGSLLFGAGPLAILVWGLLHGGRSNGETAAALLKLSAGGLAALAPLTLYHLLNGSVGAWFHDAFSAAVTLVQLPFIEQARYVNLILLALGGILVPRSPAAFVNGLFWLVLVMLALTVSLLVLWSLWRGDHRGGARRHALPIVASFYALVAVHYQIPIYLLYTVALSLAGLLLLAAERSVQARRGAIGFAIFLSATGLWFHAGQPLDRGLAGIVTGQRAPAPVAAGLAKADLRIGAGEAAVYRDLVALIRSETADDASILVVPFSPEIYYLSGRSNPTRFYNSALGVTSDRDLRGVLDKIASDPPLLVFFRPNDKYNTIYSTRIMDVVRARYEQMKSRAGFEIYRYRLGAREAR